MKIFSDLSSEELAEILKEAILSVVGFGGEFATCDDEILEYGEQTKAIEEAIKRIGVLEDTEAENRKLRFALTKILFLGGSPETYDSHVEAVCREALDGEI